MTGYEDSHKGGYRRGHNGVRVTNGRRHLRDEQGPGHRPRLSRRGERMRNTSEGAGMRCGAQRQAAEAYGWQVGAKPR